MRATCPECGMQSHVSSFFVEDEGKRLAMIVACMAPDLGRAVLAYLSLFKPAAAALRMARAVQLAQDVGDLVSTGAVAQDERSGSRPATAATWAAGIETMLAQRRRLPLPLESHDHLRTVVFGLAGATAAAAERPRENAARGVTPPVTCGAKGGATVAASPNKETPLQQKLAWIQQRVELDFFTPEQADAERAAARKKFGADDEQTS